MSFDQTRRYIELTQFEFEESPNGKQTSLRNLESTLSRAEEVFGVATSLGSERAWNDWQQLTPAAKNAESELRDFAAKRIERVASSDVAKDTDANLSTAFARWTETMEVLHVKNSRVALVSQIVTEVL